MSVFSRSFRMFMLLFLSLSVSLQAKPRLVILADMGNEPDEEQQMMHMLMYCNEFQLEGLIAVSGKFLHEKRNPPKHKVYPDKFMRLIDGYAQVRDNLLLHASDWPTAAYLRSIVGAGSNTYGINAVGDGRSNEGSNLVLEAIKRNLTEGSLYVCVNAGSNTLAQALLDLRADATISAADKEIMLKRIFVFENGAQDNSGAWIANQFPKITWNRSNHQTYAYGGEKGKPVPGPYCWEPYERTPQGQHDWAEIHIMKRHGALGALFPYRFNGNGFLEGGGTTPWMGLANKGLFDFEQMRWGGWSGRCTKEKRLDVPSRHNDIVNGQKGLTPAEKNFRPYWMYEADAVTEEWTDPVHQETFSGHMVPVWRFRRAMWNDFQCRMDWCVKPFDKANHNPVATLDGDVNDTIVFKQARPGEVISLDASASTDPDGDKLTYHWFYYPEAGTYTGDVVLQGANTPHAQATIPTDANGTQIHIVLQVTDDNAIASMVDYRRTVINVSTRR